MIRNYLIFNKIILFKKNFIQQFWRKKLKLENIINIDIIYVFNKQNMSDMILNNIILEYLKIFYIQSKCYLE